MELGKNTKVIFDEGLISLDMNSINRDEVIKHLSKKLFDYGCVTKDFCQSVIKREKISGTGLPTEIPVAIPHTEKDFCLLPAIAMARLENPVEFKLIAKENDSIQVKFVFLLSLPEGYLQIHWLRKLIDFFQIPNSLGQLIEIKTKEQIVEYLRKYLFK